MKQNNSEQTPLPRGLRAVGAFVSKTPLEPMSVGAPQVLRVSAVGESRGELSQSSREGSRIRCFRSRVLWVFVALAALALPQVAGGAQPLETGDMTPSEENFIRQTIFRWGLTDVARMWLNDRLQQCSAKSRPDFEYFKADCLVAEGKNDEFTAELKRLGKKYPNHPRSKAGQLDLIKAAMLDVVAKHLEAIEEPKADRKKQFFGERDQIFQSRVVSPLDSSISAFNAEIDREQDDNRLATLVARRDEWEHYRVLAYRNYAQKLEAGSDSHKAAWEKALELATLFVEERYDNFARQCECQLVVGQSHAQLGNVSDAADNFDMLVEISPATEPPYSPVQIRFIRWLRLQAIEGTANAWNLAGNPTEAVALFDRIQNNPDPNFPMRKSNEDEALVSFVIAAEIEEAISRAAGGDDARGVELFNEMLDRWTAKDQTDPAGAFQNLLATAQGLSRLLDLGGGSLPARFYRYAGTGYQLRGMFPEAVRAWKQGLVVASPIRKQKALCADMLNQIGQTYLLMDRPAEAAMAFLQVLETYEDDATEESLALAAQNAFAAVDPLADRLGGGWEELRTAAKEAFGRHGSGEAAQQLLLTRAAEEEAKGRYGPARDLYLQVAKNVDGRIPTTYFKGRAGAARCLFLKEKAAAKAAAGLEEALKELDEVESDAKAAGNEQGRAALVFERASMLFDESVRDRDKALAALEPFENEMRGAGQARELGLNLWVNLMLPQGDGAPNPMDLAEADRIFDLMKKDYPDSIFITDLLVSLMDAQASLGTEESKQRAADLVEVFTNRPDVKLDQMEPPSILYFASILVDASRATRATSLLEMAQAKVDGTDPDLDLAVRLTFARVLLASDDANRSLEQLNELEKSYGGDLRDGVIADAPTFYFTRARARLKMYEEKRQAKILKDTVVDLETALAIVGQRRASLRGSAGGVPPQMERSYWDGWLQLLKVFKAQKQTERVVKHVLDFEYRGAKIPADLVPEFEKIKKESGG